MNPLADPAAQVRSGTARFTVLTSRLIRMEWSPTGVFEDRGTYAFPNRRSLGAPPAFRHRIDPDGCTVIETAELSLRYRPDGPFAADNLSVELTGALPALWRPGLVDDGNLGGARRTVDGCRGEAALEPGLLSRSGWAVVDDSHGVPFDADGWVVQRENVDALDWYFFGYGHAYADAVADYTSFGGPVGLVPRWMLGLWWSKYWPYSETDFRALVADFEAHDIPLDVLVIDMDWHTTDSWTGYTWNRELFPDPAAFLAWLHSRGLHTTLNLHPALGVQAFEEAYPAFARAMGVDPASREPIPFRIADKRFVEHYFRLLHHPHEDAGVDFWWIDWQQGRSSELSGLDPLPWLNHLHFHDFARRPDRRPVIFSRWGGLGSHRYPIGFSGDSFSTWEALRFQPRYTAAGAAVAYGWWSHDIGGHFGLPEPELYLRWLQFGAFSPILRLHSNQSPEAERRPWGFGPAILAAAREAIAARYELVPYLYTAARIATDTGHAMVRPVWWIAPEDDGAYAAREEYLLGGDLLVAPALRPTDPDTGTSTVDVYLPAGDWIERTTGETFRGPRWARLAAGLHAIPQFVRPGTILPLAADPVATTAQDDAHRVLSVFPGAAGSTRVYDDDGDSSAFQAGAFSWTTVALEWVGRSATLTIGPAVGDWTVAGRQWTVRLEHTVRVARAFLDGQPVDWRSTDGAVVVEVPQASGRLVVEGVEPVARPAAAQGPMVHVIEHTAPEEARVTLGRVVVAGGDSAVGRAVDVRAEVEWTLEVGGAVRTSKTLAAVGPAGAVLPCPEGWDGTLTPARWTADVTLTHAGGSLRHQHRSAAIAPALTAWLVLAGRDADVPHLDAVLADLARADLARADLARAALAQTDPAGAELDRAELDRFGPRLPWRRVDADPADPDFAQISDPHIVFFARPDLPESEPLTAYAAGAIRLERDLDLTLRCYSGAELEVYVDGLRVGLDGPAEPISLFTMDPTPRVSEPVRLSAGDHQVLIVARRAPEVWLWSWYLIAICAPPGEDTPMTEVRSLPGA